MRGTDRTPKAGTRTQYVLYVGPWGQAALRLRYVPNAGGWYAQPVRNPQRRRGVRVSLDRNWRTNLNFCAELYDIQRKAGRCFVHKHPKSACSWKESSINDITEDDEIYKADACVCAPSA